MQQPTFDQFNTTIQLPSRDVTLSQLIAGTASRFPGRPAVRRNGSTINYDDLFSLGGRIGAGITALCPSTGHLVGVLMDRSIELVAGLLAVHQTGNAFVPMDPLLPPGRLSSILRDSRPALILTQPSLSDSLEQQAIPFVCVENILEGSSRDETDFSGALYHACSPRACVLYTSGSTGEPKGVDLRHDGIINQISWRKERFQIDCEDRILQTFSLAFDPSMWEIFGTLEAGGCIVISDETHDASRIARCVHDEGVTVMQTVPSILKQLLDQEEFRACSSLRHVLCGGDVLEPDTVRRFYDTLGSARLHNLYGPTEATMDATCWTCSPPRGSRSRDEQCPIGRSESARKVARWARSTSSTARSTPSWRSCQGGVDPIPGSAGVDAHRGVCSTRK